MRRGLFWLITGGMLVGGLALLGYLLLSVPPTDSSGALDVPAVVLFFIGLGLVGAGLGSLIAAILQRQWPALAGGGAEHGPAWGVALRQGVLFAAALLVLAGLALFQQLDIAFVAVTLVMVGLVEAFIQSRG